MRPSLSILHVALTAGLVAGCAEAELDGDLSVESAPLSAAAAANLAYPEYDLNVPAGWAWMHSTDVAGIQGRIAQGYRLVSIDVVTSAPLILAGTFVANTGVYARTGHGFDGDLTQAEMNSVLADTTRRVVDLAVYKVGSEKRYAAAWVGNTGTQQKTYKVVLGATRQTFENEVAAFNGRVVDLTITAGSAPGPDDREFHAVMIKNTGDDQRDQWLGTSTGLVLVEEIAAVSGRLADLEPWQFGSFYHVIEEVLPGEQTWWAAELTGDGSPDNPDSVFHQTSRFGGRYLRLKGHQDGTGMRYYGWLADNGAVPSKGTDNAGNTTLDKIDAAVARQMKRAGVPGAALAVVRNGKLIHAKGYGLSNIGTGRVTEPTDMFRMASVTKTITGAAILRLIQDGTTIPSWLPGAGAPLTLDTRPFGQIWSYTQPNHTPNLGWITLRHLLEHSTGLHGSFELDVTPSDWIAREASMGAASFRHTPGQAGAAGDNFYKNTHYYMLGGAVVALRFQLFDDYVRTTFFDPLGIRRVRAGLATPAPEESGLFQARNYERPGRFARSFRKPDGTIDASPADHTGDEILTPLFEQPAIAYAASPIDLLRFATSVDGSRPGPRALDAQRFGWIQSQVSPALAGTGRLLGWFGLPHHHGGYLPGVAHAHVRLRGDGVKYAFMSNSDSMTNLALQTSNRRNFEGELVNELNGIFAAESHLLPDRDLFDQYVPPPCNSDFHGLPMASFQTCYNFWTAIGLQPQTLTASPDGSRISGSFQWVGPRRTHHLIPAASYEAVTQEEFKRGVIPNHVNVVNLGGDLRFTATWVSAGGAGYGSWWGMTPSVFEQRLDDFYAEHMLTDFFLYQDNGLKMAATWRRQQHSGYIASYDLTESAFDSVNAFYLEQGFKPTHFVAYNNDAGQQRFAAIWRPVSGDWILSRSSSWASYQVVYNWMKAFGYRIYQMHSWGADNYAAVWTTNMSEP